MLPYRINISQTGKNIHSLRKQHGISVKDMQQMLGLSVPQTIYRWQSGDNLPSIDNLVLLSEIFKTPIESILAIEGG